MSPVLSNFDPSIIFQILFYLAVLIFVIHAAITAYHWMSFGSEKKVSAIGVTAYLCGGAILIIALSITLYQI